VGDEEEEEEVSETDTVSAMGMMMPPPAQQGMRAAVVMGSHAPPSSSLSVHRTGGDPPASAPGTSGLTPALDHYLNERNLIHKPPDKKGQRNQRIRQVWYIHIWFSSVGDLREVSDRFLCLAYRHVTKSTSDSRHGCKAGLTTVDNVKSRSRGLKALLKNRQQRDQLP